MEKWTILDFFSHQLILFPFYFSNGIITLRTFNKEHLKKYLFMYVFIYWFIYVFHWVRHLNKQTVTSWVSTCGSAGFAFWAATCIMSLTNDSLTQSSMVVSTFLSSEKYP